jgi:hypothetical protein
MNALLNAFAIVFFVGLGYSLIQLLLGRDVPNWIG